MIANKSINQLIIDLFVILEYIVILDSSAKLHYDIQQEAFLRSRALILSSNSSSKWSPLGRNTLHSIVDIQMHLLPKLQNLMNV